MTTARTPSAGLASVADIIADRMPSFGTRPAIRYDDGQTYRSIDYATYGANIRRGLALFESTGPQRIVATFVQNRPEWDLVALASLYTGNILFPLDPKAHDAEVVHLLRMSPPDLVLVSPASRVRMVNLLHQIGLSPRIVVADLVDTWEDRDAPSISALRPDEVWLSSVMPVSELPPPSARLDDPDLVLGHYATSGTTTLPKVVRITHGNVVAQINEGIDVMTLRDTEDVLNIGPYTHIATLLEFLVTKARGYTVTYFTREPDEDGVLEAEIKKLRRVGVRIRALMAVPKFWVFLMKEVLEELKDKAIWRSLYDKLINIERQAGMHDMGTLDKAKLNAVKIFVRNKLGGHFTFGVSSSTRIDPGVITIFAKLGITVIDIYGASEASGIIARNRLNDSRPGSCGRLIAGLDFRVAEPRQVPGIAAPVGELLIAGPTIARGYVGQPEGAHRDDDGFYRTGDLARVDGERWVYLVGRAKELLTWDDSSLIDRMHLSNLMIRSIWVKDALVTRLGADPFLSVFALPDWPRLRKDATYRQEIEGGVEPDAALRSRLIEAVAYAQSLANISARMGTERLYVLSRPLERTPTHKIKFVRELERLDLTAWV